MIQWLSLSPFFVLSSVSPSGIDCSPRGDSPGKAFRILDKHTIAIPDRQGNNRIDTLRNILEDSRVGIVFIIPGVDEAVRVKGRADISVDQTLLDSFAIDGEPPVTVMLITIKTAYVQNARAIRAAALWDEHLSNDEQFVPSSSDLYNSN